MKIRPMPRAWAVAVFAASLVAIAGCTAARRTSNAQATVADEATTKKEYQWKDLSAGAAFSRRAKPTPAF